jgi:hypothetical protein
MRHVNIIAIPNSAFVASVSPVFFTNMSFMYKLQLIEQSIHDKHAHPSVATDTILKTD